MRPGPERHRAHWQDTMDHGTVSKMEMGRLASDIEYLSKFAHILRLEPAQSTELMRLAGVVPQGTTPASVLRLCPAFFWR